MDRQQVLDCLNSGHITAEFAADWVANKVPADKVSQAVNVIVQQGLIPSKMINEMLIKYEINQVLSENGEHIVWY